jgi:hypothetical protein
MVQVKTRTKATLSLTSLEVEERRTTLSPNSLQQGQTIAQSLLQMVTDYLLGDTTTATTASELISQKSQKYLWPMFKNATGSISTLMTLTKMLRQ